MALLERLQEIIGPKIFRHAVTFDNDVGFRKKYALKCYDTGWITRSDWTNVHLGSSTTKNVDSNVTHNLGAPLSKLLVKVFVSTDGTDANSLEIILAWATDVSSYQYGATVYEIDNNNLKIQTGTQGLPYFNDSGAGVPIDTEDWFYKVKVWYIG